MASHNYDSNNFSSTDYDASLTLTKTFTLDIVVIRGRQFKVDLIAKYHVPRKEFTVDILAKKKQTTSFTIDLPLGIIRTKTFNVNILSKSLSSVKTFTEDILVKNRSQITTLTTDILVKTSHTKTYTTDIKIKKRNNLKTFTMDIITHTNVDNILDALQTRMHVRDVLQI